MPGKVKVERSLRRRLRLLEDLLGECEIRNSRSSATVMYMITETCLPPIAFLSLSSILEREHNNGNCYEY